MPMQPRGPAAWRLPGWEEVVDSSGVTRVKIKPVTQELVHKLMLKYRTAHGAVARQNNIISTVIERRNTRLRQTVGEQAIVELKQAFYTRQNVRPKGVYIWVHPTLTQQYVGSFGRGTKSCFAYRLTTHLQKANGLCKQRAEYALQTSLRDTRDPNCPKRLYMHLISDGLQEWHMLPLQLLPNDATDQQVLACEQGWMDYFNTRQPHGLNAIRACVAASGVVAPLGVGRWYGSRDMCHEVYACWVSYGRERLGDQNFQSYFEPYATRNLIKMHCFCDGGRSPEGVSSLVLLAQWLVPNWFVQKLALWLKDMLAVRLERPAPSAKRSRKKVICNYSSTVYDNISVTAAMGCDAAQRCLPQAMKDYFREQGFPVFAFEYSKCLGLMFCNHSKLAQQLDSSELAALTMGSSSESQCVCERHGQWLRENGHIPEGLQHVVTCKSGVMKFATSDARTLFEQGFKHRPEQSVVTMSESVRQEVVEDFGNGLRQFVSDLVHVHGNAGNMQGFVEAVCEDLKQQLRHSKFSDGRVFRNASKPHEPGTVFTPWRADFKKDIKWLHKFYTVTRADKLSNNYVVVCLKYYVSQVLSDLDSGQFYIRVLSSGNISVIDKVAGEILQAWKQLARHMFWEVTDAQLLEQLKLLPYAAALVKLHKTPLQFRFLACSGSNGLRPVALWVNALLKAVHQDIIVAWQKLLNDLDVDWKHHPPWYATRSAQIVQLVKYFNRMLVSVDDFTRGGGWQGFDVVRLYTNIPQDDLVQSLSNLLGELVWDRHSVQRNGPRYRLLKVYKDTAFGAEWLPVNYNLEDFLAEHPNYDVESGNGMKTDRWGRESKSKGDFYVFDWKEATDVLTLLVKFSFVRFGDQVWHQQVGIPMGINPAVYMANYYLFYYEYCFLKQFKSLLQQYQPLPGGNEVARGLFEANVAAAEGADVSPVWVSAWPESVHASFKGNVVFYVLNQFNLMGRFVDDLTSGPNMFLRHLLNRSNTIIGGLIHGIYPDCLTLERTNVDSWSFPTLDVRIVSSQVPQCDDSGIVVGHIVVSETELYDKRREKCYDGIPVVQYTHVSSTLSQNVTNSILLGQLHRYRELIMRRNNYILECAMLIWRMIGRGYKREILFAKLKRYLRRYPDTFGDTSFRPLFTDIQKTFRSSALMDHFAGGEPLVV